MCHGQVQIDEDHWLTIPQHKRDKLKVLHIVSLTLNLDLYISIIEDENNSDKYLVIYKVNDCNHFKIVSGKVVIGKRKQRWIAFDGEYMILSKCDKNGEPEKSGIVILMDKYIEYTYNYDEKLLKDKLIKVSIINIRKLYEKQCRDSLQDVIH